MLYLFTIFDTKSLAAGPIFTTKTVAEGERQFNDAMTYQAPEGSLWRTHPEDFQLVLIGEFDDRDPLITNTTKTIIATGKKPEISTEVTA